MAKGRPKNTLNDLWSRVDVRGDGDCWNWMGSTRHGYGNFCVDKVTHYPHRVAWELANGEAPPSGKDFHVMHVCNNKLCCNPKHLVLGTAKQNTEDAFKDGLAKAGGRHHLTKYPKDLIEAIKSDGRTQMELSQIYGVSQQHISRIKAGKARNYEELNNVA